jgi:hypothetical protein
MRRIVLFIGIGLALLSCGQVIIGDLSKATYARKDLYLYNDPVIALLPMYSENVDFQKYLGVADSVLADAFNNQRSNIKVFDANYIFERLKVLGWVSSMDELREKIKTSTASKNDRSNAGFYNDLCQAIGAQYALRTNLEQYKVEEKVVLGTPSRYLLCQVNAGLWDAIYRDISMNSEIKNPSFGDDLDFEHLQATEASGLIAWEGYGKGEATGPIEQPPPAPAELIGKTCEGLVKKLP